jgi:signal transduction histidine kinase/ligand-binding sensor domain-containing protein/DNA-binding response OmpR family regulator
MWFATEDGLNKYDGYNFTMYHHDPEDSLSISDNWVYTLHESHYAGKHVLWIGTLYGGLNKLDLETEQFTHFRHDPEDPKSLSHDRISSVYEDSSGELWIGTWAGVNKLDRKIEKFIRYQHDPDNPNSLSDNEYCTLHESHIAGSSILWVGTWGGLNKFDRKTQKFTRYLYDRQNPNSLSNNNINGLFTDTSGMLWIATQEGGLNKFNIEAGLFTRFQHDPDDPKSLGNNTVISIVESNFSNNNVLWITSFNGLEQLDLATNQFTHYQHNPSNPKSLSDNNLHSMYKDRTGIIWIGTWGGGINKFSPERQKFAHYTHKPGDSNDLSNNYVNSITESECYEPNVFWIGTKNGGLNKYSRDTGKFTHYRHDPENPNSLSDDLVIVTLESHFQGRDELWIGTYSGLDKFDLNTKKFTRYQHNPDDTYSISNNIIRSIYEDKTGTLWIGTRNGGLNKFDRTSGEFNSHRYFIGEVLSIIEDDTGTLWAGTDQGLFLYNSDTDDFSNYNHDPNNPYSLSHNSVLSIYEDKSSGLWVGTSDGLNLYDRETKKFARYKVKDGLPNNVINGILEDDHGNLWLSTNHGLSAFDPKEKKFRNYDMYDGLQSDQFTIGASCLSKKGEMFFGGVNGFNIFHPDSIKDNPHIPDLYLTDFQIFNKKVDVKTGDIRTHDGTYYLPKHISNISEITLSYKESVFSFEFAALDFFSPQKNRYRYKMEDVDPEWVYTDASRRSATYTQLDPGNYIFRVNGSNNDGLWNKEGTSIKIIITPPWWWTTWAYSAYVLLFALTLYALRTYDQKRQRLKHDLELEHVHAEKLEEVDHLKSRFFANISHEFRTPLTLILGPLKQMISGDFKGNLIDQYKIALRNGERLLKLINQLLDLSKLESGKLKIQAQEIDIISLTNELVQAFESVAVRKNITLIFRTEIKSQEIYLDKDKYEKIINNLLSNAFKFTLEGGEIGVTIKILNFKHQNTNKFQIPNSKLPITNSQSPVPNSDFVEITISNTGPGISANHLNKIFDRFYQVDDSYTKDGEGTGIGLALTKELVELHHGEIKVESEIDKKTIFTISLPLGKEHLSEDEIVDAIIDSTLENGVRGLSKSLDEITISESSELYEKSGRSPASSLPSSIILIVEDNADLRKYISGNLDNQYRIFEAENGEEGLERATNEIPDLIISDVMMPKMDGFEFCARIKTDERTSHIPVILITARAAQEDKLEGLETGADDYITKPFDNKELNVRVKNLIEQRRKLRERFARESNFFINNIAHTSTDEKFIKRVMDIISRHISDSKFNIDNLSEKAGLSRMHLHRKILGLFGQSPGDFLRTIRLKRGAELLKEKSGNISEIAYEVGFENPANFSTSFRQQFGISPSEYSKKLHDA